MSTTEMNERDSEAWERIVRQQVNSMRFGLVQIIVHEGRVVQIEKTEKLRVDQIDARKSDRF